MNLLNPIMRKDQHISYNKEDGTVTVSWDTGGMEGAINGFTFKAEILKEHISDYKAPRIDWNQDYNEAF